MTQHESKLEGCNPTPLAGYLKALGVLRIVAQQVDPLAQGAWNNDVFVLQSKFDRDSLINFFLNDYHPTPLVTPWNGGSGFFSKDNKAAIEAIRAGQCSRLESYRELIRCSEVVLESMQLTEKPDANDKSSLLQQCRNQFPDNALDWLDAAFVLTDDGPKYPPLLGTGGNDGRLEFTNNYMQRLTEVFDVDTGLPAPGTRVLLGDSLFGDCGQTRNKAAIGQFDPGSAGGPNSSGGYDSGSTMNVWDFILMLEGAIAFAGAAVRKLEHSSPGSLSYPFCVRQAGVGYASADFSDESSSRSEMWMPLWHQPASFEAISHLLSEGRVEVGRRRARNGVDFARAIASVGVDRGIDSFQRFGFQQRNGLSYFAVPLDRYDVRQPSAASGLLGHIDHWLDRFRRAATGQHAPARAGTALRRVESAVLDVCQASGPQAVQRLLIAMGDAEQAIATSPKLREADYPVPPVPLLPPEWLRMAYDDDPPTASEFRLAAALASLGNHSGLRVNNKLRIDPVGPFRRHVEPIDWLKLRDKNRRSQWAEHAHDPSIVWTTQCLIQNMNRIVERRVIDAVRLSDQDLHAPFDGKCPARLDDVFRFIEGHVNTERIGSLVRGLMLVDWPAVKFKDIPWPIREQPRTHEAFPSAAYCLLKLCLLPHPIPASQHIDLEIKLTPQIVRRAVIGDLTEATRLAAQRLRASGLRPAIDAAPCHDQQRALRTAAALAFPLWHDSRRKSTAITMIRNRVVQRDTVTEGFDNEPLPNY